MLARLLCEDREKIAMAERRRMLEKGRSDFGQVAGDAESDVPRQETRSFEALGEDTADHHLRVEAQCAKGVLGKTASERTEAARTVERGEPLRRLRAGGPDRLVDRAEEI